MEHGSSRIDVVYTWVNHSDPSWLKMYEDACASADSNYQTHTTANNIARFQNRNELLFSIKSIKKYAPWVRNIYVLTNCSLPEQLATDTQVTRIDHEAVFPDPTVLPCFNSRAIESNLHRIEGLAEKFLYFNDDVFLCRPTTQRDFYTEDGKAYLFPCKTPIPHGKTENLTPVEHGQLNASKLLMRDFGLRPEKKLHHAPFPMLKSTLAEIDERYSEQINATRSHKFRDSRDIPLATTMHGYYSLAKGYGEIKHIASRYVDIGDPLFLLLIHPFSPLRRGKYISFCMNEVSGIRHFSGWRDAIVNRLLKTMLDD